MILLLDTHTLVWFLERDPQLGASAKAALTDDSAVKAISVMTLLEIQHMQMRGRTNLDPSSVLSEFQEAGGLVVPLTPGLMAFMPPGLEIHDSIILATGHFLAQSRGGNVALVTRDAKMTAAASSLQVIW